MSSLVSMGPSDQHRPSSSPADEAELSRELQCDLRDTLRTSLPVLLVRSSPFVANLPALPVFASPRRPAVVQYACYSLALMTIRNSLDYAYTSMPGEDYAQPRVGTACRWWRYESSWPQRVAVVRASARCWPATVKGVTASVGREGAQRVAPGTGANAVDVGAVFRPATRYAAARRRSSEPHPDRPEPAARPVLRPVRRPDARRGQAARRVVLEEVPRRSGGAQPPPWTGRGAPGAGRSRACGRGLV